MGYLEQEGIELTEEGTWAIPADKADTFGVIEVTEKELEEDAEAEKNEEESPEEDGSGEEPSAKRAKTEGEEEEVVEMVSETLVLHVRVATKSDKKGNRNAGAKRAYGRILVDRD